jgi:hypothetical protein
MFAVKGLCREVMSMTRKKTTLTLLIQIQCQGSAHLIIAPNAARLMIIHFSLSVKIEKGEAVWSDGEFNLNTDG